MELFAVLSIAFPFLQAGTMTSEYYSESSATLLRLIATKALCKYYYSKTYNLYKNLNKK